MILWRIYYDDGTSFSNQEGNPESAPVVGVIALNQATPTDEHRPFETHFSADWYWWDPRRNRWGSGDTHGFLDNAMRLGAVWPKQGRWVPDAEYQLLLGRAQRDSDFWHDPRG